MNAFPKGKAKVSIDTLRPRNRSILLGEKSAPARLYVAFMLL